MTRHRVSTQIQARLVPPKGAGRLTFITFTSDAELAKWRRLTLPTYPVGTEVYYSERDVVTVVAEYARAAKRSLVYKATTLVACVGLATIPSLFIVSAGERWPLLRFGLAMVYLAGIVAAATWVDGHPEEARVGAAEWWSRVNKTAARVTGWTRAAGMRVAELGARFAGWARNNRRSKSA